MNNTPILDHVANAFSVFKKALIGEHKWHKRWVNRGINIRYKNFELSYQAHHQRKYELR